MKRELLLTAKEAASYLQKKPGTLAQWRFKNYGPSYIKNGGSCMYRKSDLDAWIESRTVGGVK